MLDPQASHELLAKTLSSSRADETEATLGGGQLALTRFANNTILQNVFERSLSLSVRCAFGRRTGRASTNNVSLEGLREVAASAEEIARHSPEDDALLPLPEAAAYETPPDAWDEATAASTAEQRAAAVQEAVEYAKKRGVTLAGSYSIMAGEIGEWGDHGTLAIMNSAGLFAWHRRTRAAFTVTASVGDGSGWASAESHRASDLDPMKLTRTAMHKAFASRNPVELAAGTYDVVLEPAAAAVMLAHLADGFGAQDVEENLTFVSGHLGELLVGTNINVSDNFKHSLHRGEPFDDEGVPRHRVQLIEQGEARNLVHDRRTARRAGTRSTGHGQRVPSTWGPQPAYIVLEPGNKPASSMIDLMRGLHRGLLVTRFWYESWVDRRQGVVTGMTRDGLFLVEDGEIVAAVRHMRFNQNVLRMFQSVERMTKPVLAEGVVTGALLVRDFCFDSATEF